MIVDIIYTSLAALALFAFSFGFVNILKQKKGYFYVFTVLGFFGLAIGHIFTFLLIIIDGDYDYTFSLGSLGVVSAFMSLSFAANTIQKVDAGEINDRRKYVYIAYSVPVFFVLCWVILLFGNVGFQKMIIPSLFLVSAMPCAYMSLLNIITPYPEKSFVRCFRPFFTVLFVFCIDAMLGEMMWLVPGETASTVLDISLWVVSVCCYILMPVLLERNYKKWMNQ